MKAIPRRGLALVDDSTMITGATKHGCKKRFENTSCRDTAAVVKWS